MENLANQSSPFISSIDQTKAATRLREVLKKWGRIYLNPLQISSELQAFHDSNFAKFHRDLTNWCDLVEEFSAHEPEVPASIPSNKTRDLFRYYFNRMGLTVSQSFTDSIMEGDVVEVFSNDGKRIFFNPELFDYSSYPPDVMFSAPFWMLYRRDEEISKMVLEAATRVFTGQVEAPFDPQISPHIVTETQSLHRFSAQVEIKLLAPIYLGRGLVGAAALEKFKLVVS